MYNAYKNIYLNHILEFYIKIKSQFLNFLNLQSFFFTCDTKQANSLLILIIVYLNKVFLKHTDMNNTYDEYIENILSENFNDIIQ